MVATPGALGRITDSGENAPFFHGRRPFRFEDLGQFVRIFVSVVLVGGWTDAVGAQPLSVYDVQFTSSADGDSNYDGAVVDCVGGIVVGKYQGTRPRLIIQDSNDAVEWGAIQVKDWSLTLDLFQSAKVGDWIELSNTLVEEFRGTTILQWQAAYDPGFAIVSVAHPLPQPVIVSVGDVAAPLEGPVEEWYVLDHHPERFESMRLIVRDVTVTQMHLGKAVDNYNLRSAGGEDCWATDYMNTDSDPWGYHPFVTLGQHFCAVAGVFEQYTRLIDGWDYYQLVTQASIDLMICGDGNGDGVVDLDDAARLAECLCGPSCGQPDGGCHPPAWTAPPVELPVQACLTTDLDYDGDVDMRDVAAWQLLLASPL